MQQWSTPQFYLPPVTPIVFRLLVLFGFAWILEVVAQLVGQPDLRALWLHFGSEFHPLQIFTHIFYIAPPGIGGIIELLFQGLVLYFFGSDLERQWGSSNFLRFFFVSLIGGAALPGLASLFPQLAGQMVFGINGAESGLLLAYAILWPDRKVLLFFIIPIRMKWLILLLWVFLAVLGGVNVFLIYLGGALAGTAFIYYYARRGRSAGGEFGPPGPEFSGMTGSGGSGGSSANAPGLADRTREYFRKRRLRKKQAEIERRINVKDEVDRLLEKISREGIDSLTRKEKSFLDKASKEF